MKRIFTFATEYPDRLAVALAVLLFLVVFFSVAAEAQQDKTPVIGAGDDLTAQGIVSKFADGACTGYLKSDGGCDSPNADTSRLLDYRAHAFWRAHAASSTGSNFASFGGAAPFVNGTAGVGGAPVALGDRLYVRLSTAATTNSIAGVGQNETNIFRAYGWRGFARARFVTTANARLQVGMISTGATAANITNAGMNVAAFYACNDSGSSCTADHTSWQCYVRSGAGTPYEFNSGVAVDSEWHTFEIVEDTAGQRPRFFIDGSEVCTGASAAAMSAAYTSIAIGTGLRITANIIALEPVAKSADVNVIAVLAP